MTITRLRTWHAMISAFIAPMVVFFSLSGALQIFDFHQSHGSYTASAFLSAIGRLHKDQIFSPVRKKPPAAATASAPRHVDPPMRRATLLLKILFFWEAVGLAVTTLIGAWIAVTHPRYARRSWVLLGAGTVVPILLIVI